MDYDDDLEAAVAKNGKTADTIIRNWLSKGKEYKLNKQKLIAPEQERLYHRKFVELSAKKVQLKTILPFLRKYFSKCIIQPEVTEMVFWALSCLPSTNKDTLCRLNIFWQEVLAIFYLEKEKTYAYAFQLKKSLFKGTDIERLVKKYNRLQFNSDFYKSGGQDQFRMEIYDTKQAMDILDELIIIKSIKEFNLHLMRLGPTTKVNGPFHCMELSRLILNNK